MQPFFQKIFKLFANFMYKKVAAVINDDYHFLFYLN